ncbi:MAG: 30S ribosome-binding factor RbfA [Candidatus Krumholzibacteriota bacterium]|nr:30S ribosome-binding factor RbfA [Candidatus Krumholzibacteriota bacterium]
MNNKYKGRVEETIHQLVAELIVRRVKDPRVENVSIIRVSVSGDYSVAKLYYNIIGGSDDLEDVESGLKSARGYIRNKIKKHLRLRVIPELVFIYDSSLDKAMALEEIIEGIHEEEPVKEDDSAENDPEEEMENG